MCCQSPINFSKVNELRHIEELTANLNNWEETFRDTCRPWQYFVYTVQMPTCWWFHNLVDTLDSS